MADLDIDKLRGLRDALSPKLHELSEDFTAAGNEIYKTVLDYYQTIIDRMIERRENGDDNA